jgi:hypothetical membrane protein
MLDIRFLAGLWESRFLLLAGILAPVLLVTAIVWAGFMETDYSHAAQFVSELGAAGVAHRWILNDLGLVPSGFLTVVFSVGMYFRLRPGGWLATGCALVALAGIGRLVAGIYPCDAGCSLEGMSMSARIHALAGFVALASGALAPMVLAVGLRRRSEILLFQVSAGLGSVSVVAVVFLFGLGPGMAYVGTIQRLILAAFYGWIVFLAVEMGVLRRQNRDHVKAA